MRASRRGSTRRARKSRTAPTAPSTSCAPCSRRHGSAARSARRSRIPAPASPRTRRRPSPAFSTRTSLRGSARCSTGTLGNAPARGRTPPAVAHGGAAVGCAQPTMGGIGALSQYGAGARFEVAETGPRATRFGPEAAKRTASLSRAKGAERVFPDELASDRRCFFWCGASDEAELPILRIHNCRHTRASQGIVNSACLPTMGWSPGRRRLVTTAISAHLDDSASQAAAEWTASRIATATEFKAETLSKESDNAQIRSHPPGSP